MSSLKLFEMTLKSLLVLFCINLSLISSRVTHLQSSTDISNTTLNNYSMTNNSTLFCGEVCTGSCFNNICISDDETKFLFYSSSGLLLVGLIVIPCCIIYTCLSYSVKITKAIVIKFIIRNKKKYQVVSSNNDIQQNQNNDIINDILPHGSSSS